jgi:hypothetical protein
MAKFKIYASYRVNLELDIDAENIDDAWQIAWDANGADFKRLPDSDSDWEINDIAEVKNGKI